MPTEKKVLLILVGGNSESISGGGIKKLYLSREKFADSALAKYFKEKAGLNPHDVEPYYFSWTGDDEDHKGFLPGHWRWISGGDERIQMSLNNVLGSLRATQQLMIMGWSNGGATAYDLACALSARRSVDLFVTLDPVSWTTSPCVGTVARRWIDVYTAGGPRNRLTFGNIVALLGHAWDNDALPTRPTSLHRFYPANHGDTNTMMETFVLEDKVFKDWVERLPK